MKKETYSYKGWLNSDNFYKRAFAIFGYSLIPILLFYGAIAALVIIVIILGLAFA